MTTARAVLGSLFSQSIFIYICSIYSLYRERKSSRAIDYIYQYILTDKRETGRIFLEHFFCIDNSRILVDLIHYSNDVYVRTAVE